jgi:secreted trypsin-like serine protease
MAFYIQRLIYTLFVSMLLASPTYLSASMLNDMPAPKIIGGDSTTPGEYPEFAILRIYQPDAERFGQCSATLIAPDKILTAAHCIREVDQDSRFTVIPAYHKQSISEQKQLEVAVRKVDVHPDYGSGSFDLEADVAVLTLERALASKVASVLIAGVSIDGESATILGAGLTNFESQTLASVLQKFDTVIQSNESCNEDELGGVFYEPYHICISPRFASAVPCFGDSGGPILIETGGRRAVAGVASGGDTLDCDVETTFSVYARVSRYADFIKQHSPNTRFIRAGKPAPVIVPFLNLLLSTDLPLLEE